MDSARSSKILITSGAWQASMACIQSLGRRKCEIDLLDPDPQVAIAHSRYCHGQVVCPAEEKEAEYFESLLNLIQGRHYDVLLPVSDRCARLCAQHQEELRPFIHFVLPDYETLMLAVDKTRTYEFAIDHKIPIPETYFPSIFAEVEKLAERDIFPCVVKLPLSVSGKGVFYAPGKKELLRLFRSQDFEGQWPVIQELIEGDFYGLTP